MSTDPIRLDSIDAAISAMAAGQAVVVVDDADRENEGDIIFAAEFATPELMGWTIRHSSGVVCTPMDSDRADAMGLPPMVEDNQDAKGTAYTVSCDAAHGVSTGISAADRALTSRILADPASGPELITRPGHIFPLRAVAGGVLVRRGHTEASVDLCKAAGLEPVGVIAELVHDDGSMMRLPALREFADLWNLPLVSIEDLAAWRATSDAEPAVGTSAAAVQGGPEVRVPTPHGEFMVRAWRERSSGNEHLSLSATGPDGTMPLEPLVRVHSECLTGDVFGSYRCDCGEQLAAGLEAINEFGGVLVYLRGHEGRGIGLANKIRAYALQDGGANTVAANEQLGLPVDARNYDAAAAILHALSIRRVRLITNNPLKEEWLESAGIAVTERVPTRVAARPENLEYLRTKQNLMNHSLQLPTTENTNPGVKS
ncbi:3,4-dihydroxy-2-butanone-4-phosphate synthase [Paeniglutamicibacter psychrophenolicus]|uniref:3,4-dihydroxy-2-butanone-4-phosphate synthase n=1 Tax=Paeniglutamicibacter psychrophenolicus TaxID=257454 RepID=UPI0027804591|nr:3,4-dihydroxy-2-butanone-4-phosphate synthase [Paeniglutamicibacter psychrophenolicus]MDQ0094507.1 3,4-dihydroxy 2-butanone 4-phosphate synthase/GTP cyclohydrolase II [Paeniglutamicibacter psychrophenolicus]